MIPEHFDVVAVAQRTSESSWSDTLNERQGLAVTVEDRSVTSKGHA
jgi:hypothetical protein